MFHIFFATKQKKNLIFAIICNRKFENIFPKYLSPNLVRFKQPIKNNQTSTATRERDKDIIWLFKMRKEEKEISLIFDACILKIYKAE